MTSEEFPADVGQFLADHISSVAQLEILLLLKGAPTRLWTAAELSAALRTTSETVAEQLGKLLDQGIVAAENPTVDGYRYHPSTPQLAETIDKLARVYELRRVSVITMIYSKPVDKVRTFADAFRLRQEKPK